MRRVFPIVILFTLAFLTTCGKGVPGTSQCKTDLSYVTNAMTGGEEAIRHAAEYRATIGVGSDDLAVSAIVDTASPSLIVNRKDFENGVDTILGKKPFQFNDGVDHALAVNAKDSLDVGCIEDFYVKFAVLAQESSADNYLGLSYGNPQKYEHEGLISPFFSQLVKGGLDDAFSLSLCGGQRKSSLLLGGIDAHMKDNIGSFIPITEKTAFVVPALNLKRADTKKIIGSFPIYDPANKTGTRTIIDSASSFLLLPSDMAIGLANEVKNKAQSLGIGSQFPDGYFRTERAAFTKTVRFASYEKLRQFPTFEISFEGEDGTMETLELSPLHYFKEIDTKDPLVRTFSVRETGGDVVLGQPFLENYYTYFDRKNGRIGFGNIDIACID